MTLESGVITLVRDNKEIGYLNGATVSIEGSFASSLIIGGADLRVVQELLGHSSLETTQIYTHIQKQNLADTMTSYHPLS